MIHECFLDLELPAITGSSVGKEKQEWKRGVRFILFRDGGSGERITLREQGLEDMDEYVKKGLGEC